MNSLYELYNLLHNPKLDFEQIRKTDAVRYFQFEVAQNVLKSFLCFPTLNSISFDFTEIERISNVWMGSDEETISFCDDLLEKDRNTPVPTFPNIHDSLNCDSQYNYNSGINFVNWHKQYNEISSFFYFLTEEPSTIAGLLAQNKKMGLSSEFEFNHKFNDVDASKKLEAQLLNFLGSQNLAIFMDLELENKNELNKKTKLKI